MLSGNYFHAFFNFQTILCEKESKTVCILIWKNFDSFTFTNLM